MVGASQRLASVGWAVTIGLVIGISGYLRSDFLFLPVALGFAAWGMTGRWRWATAMSLVAQLAALVMLVPWAYRNDQVCGRWLWTSSNVGNTLVTGLGEFHNPWGFGPSDADRGREATAVGIDSPFGSAGDLYFRSVFHEAVKTRPFAYVGTLIRRIPMAVAMPMGFGWNNPYKTDSFEQVRREQGLDRYDALRTRFGSVLLAYGDHLLMGAIHFVGTLCAVGLLLWNRPRRALWLLVLMPHLYAIGTHWLIHLMHRYYLASVFCWLIALAYVLARGWRAHPASDIE